jgi:drug/metabolite transporter (DMT)-like permease
MNYNSVSRLLNNVPHSVYLWTAILIFAASSSVTRKLIDLGEQNPIDGRNPISLCNVLFVGNLCALLVMLLIFYKQWNRRNLQRLTRKDWIGLIVTAILASAIAPGLIFAALDKTTVTNVVLIGRLEPPLTLALSVWLLGSRVNRWTVVGSLVSFAGIALTASIASSGPMTMMMGREMGIGQGELFAAIAAVALAISTLVSQSRLQQIPLGIFSIFRTVLGTAIFFVLALKLYGSGHFAEAFSPLLWQWMLIYGAIVVVAGQLCWFAGLRSATSSEVSLASSFNPIAAIAMAFLVLGEVPTMAQVFGGSIILLGIVLSLIGNLRQARDREKSARKSTEGSMGMAGGFKGV